MVRVLSPVFGTDGIIARDEGDGQAKETRNLEADVASHGESWPGAMYQEARANDGSRRKDEERKGGKEAVDEDEAVVARVIEMPLAFACERISTRAHMRPRGGTYRLQPSGRRGAPAAAPADSGLARRHAAHTATAWTRGWRGRTFWRARLSAAATAGGRGGRGGREAGVRRDLLAYACDCWAGVAVAVDGSNSWGTGGRAGGRCLCACASGDDAANGGCSTEAGMRAGVSGERWRRRRSGGDRSEGGRREWRGRVWKKNAESDAEGGRGAGGRGGGGGLCCCQPRNCLTDLCDGSLPHRSC